MGLDSLTLTRIATVFPPLLTSVAGWILVIAGFAKLLLVLDWYYTSVEGSSVLTLVVHSLLEAILGCWLILNRNNALATTVATVAFTMLAVISVTFYMRGRTCDCLGSIVSTAGFVAGLDLTMFCLLVAAAFVQFTRRHTHDGQHTKIENRLPVIVGTLACIAFSLGMHAVNHLGSPDWIITHSPIRVGRFNAESVERDGAIIRGVITIANPARNAAAVLSISGGCAMSADTEYPIVLSSGASVSVPVVTRADVVKSGRVPFVSVVRVSNRMHKRLLVAHVE